MAKSNFFAAALMSIATGGLMLMAFQAKAASITFSTLQNSAASATFGTVPGHGVSPGGAVPGFSWNYSGNYSDPRLPAYSGAPGFFPGILCIGLNGNCSTNNSDGVGGNDYAGFEYIYFTFNLPTGATNVRLKFDAYSNDDRGALIVNGTLIGGFHESGTVAGVTVSMKNQSGFQNVLFKNIGSLPEINNQSLFHSGENFFAIWVNNTFSGLTGTAQAHVTSGDPSAVFLRGGILYDEAVAAVPLPPALALFATGLGAIGLLGLRRRKKVTAAIAA